MKKLILLMAIILVSLTASSQTGTPTITTDSSVVLPKNVAKEVVKDIIRNDSLQAELDIMYSNIDLLMKNSAAKDSIIASKDSMITLYKLKEQNLNMMIDLQDLQKKNLEANVKQLDKDLKKEKRKLAGRTIFSTVVIGGLAYLLIK